jgi:hypothetical protein
LVVVLHVGVVPEQLALEVHCTQAPVDVLQIGVEPEQSALVLQRHFLLAPLEQLLEQQSLFLPQVAPTAVQAALAAPSVHARPATATNRRSRRRRSIGGPTCKRAADLLHRYVAGFAASRSASFARPATAFGALM